jgi:hypothetical protein
MKPSKPIVRWMIQTGSLLFKATYPTRHECQSWCSPDWPDQHPVKVEIRVVEKGKKR